MSDLIEVKKQELEKQRLEIESLQVLIESKALPPHVKSVEVAFTIAQYGKELGIPLMQSLHEIFPINGKLGMSAKLQAALARKANIKSTLIRDMEYVYPDAEGGILYTKYPISGTPYYDRETTMLFERSFPDGSSISQEVSFSLRDAQTAEVTTKDNWKKWLRNMMIARCTTKGLNLIAPDVMKGLMTLDEMHDIGWLDSKKISRDEDGYVQEVEDTEYEDQ